MQVSPWGVGGEYGREYRAIKTSRHTYVRSLDGPWLLFDDIKDPLQMNNLITNPAYKDLANEMDQHLWKLLSRLGDEFHPAQWYLDKWNLKPGRYGSIPYDMEGNAPSQTPTLTKENS
jgi:hypothetical protein